MVKQDLRIGLGLRVGAQGRDAAAAKRVMQQEIEGVGARQAEALHPAPARGCVEEMGKALRHCVFGQGGGDIGQIGRVAGDDADIGLVALVAAARAEDGAERDADSRARRERGVILERIG